MRRPSLPTGSRRWILAAAAIVVVLIVAFTVASSFYIDLLWFRELRFTSVFWTTLRTKVLLGLVFGLLFFALLYANLLIVRRSSPSGPPLRIVSPEQEALDRLRRLADPYLRWVVPAACAVLALLVGINTSSQWSTYLLWRNGQGETFGVQEALFNRDPSFYIFTLPWLHFLQSWVFSSLLGVTVLAGIAHFAWGGIQPTAPAFADKASPMVRGHLSVLLGLTLLARAWGYYLDRFDLLSSTRGVVQGASYTDIRAQLPALNVLTLVAIICALLFLVNIRLRRWSLPVIAVGLLAAVSILLGRAYPAFVQQFSVKPQEAQRESPYIQRNIDGTRAAFGLDTIETVDHPAVDAVTPADIAENRATIDNIRLWRPGVIVENFQAQERKQPYYEFADIDVDRYEVGDRRRVLLLSGREVSQTGIPGSGNSWQNSHLVYTHGYGAAAALVNSASAEGAPAFTLGNLPPEGEPAITQPQIYYGELNEVPFVVTNTDAPEFSPVIGSDSDSSPGGIELGNRLQRAMFAWRYNDLNLLISGLIKSESRILLYRQIQDRVEKAAPFLTFDADPYLAVVDGGKLVWIFDAYTTTTAYPYSQTIDLGAATQGDLAGRANYIRNSVKATVDAYTGEVRFYLVDDNDPIALAWQKVYPDLFSQEPASASLQAHYRYPENLFQVQANQYATYHVTIPSEFYQKEKVWAVAANPTAPGANQGELPPMRPYYVLMRLPGSEEEQFELILPFTPVGRENMVSWLAAGSDPGAYGKIRNYVFPSDSPVQGPSQVNSLINQEPSFSTFRTQTGQQGSSVYFGDLLVIPINDALLYVVPAYVRADQENAIPELKRVLVVNNGVVGVGANLNEALAAATGAEPPTPEDSGGGATGGGEGSGSGAGTGTVNAQLSELLTEALTHFTEADAALKAGDLATYQSELAQAQALVEQADELAAAADTTGPSVDGASTEPTIASSAPTSASSDSGAGGGSTTTAPGATTSTTASGSGAGTTTG
ncbi:MAG: UPF0182 family protein [Acidimicrobiales bacterium]